MTINDCAAFVSPLADETDLELSEVPRPNLLRESCEGAVLSSCRSRLVQLFSLMMQANQIEHSAPKDNRAPIALGAFLSLYVTTLSSQEGRMAPLGFWP